MPSTVIFDNPVTHSIFAGIEPKDVLTFILSYISIFVAFLAFNLQRESSEKTARMEMAKVLTEAFSHSEMFEAIEYFKKVSPHLVDENGKDNKSYIELIQNAPETQRYRYRILTTLHHAERLYQKEKEAEKVLFTSLITPDIVEVALCLYKIDDYMKEVDKPVYYMVYKVFEGIRTSYIKPLVNTYSREGRQIDSKKIEHTRRILSRLQDWDSQFGDTGDRIVTKTHLILLDFLEGKKLYEDLVSQLKSLEKQYEQFDQSSIDLCLMLAGTETQKDLPVKDYQKAIEYYNKALKLNADDDEICSDIYFNIAFAKTKLNRWTEAIKDYDEALELNSNDYMAYVNRGVAKIELGRHVEAEEDFQKAIELESNNPDVYEKIAKIYYTKSMREDQVKNHIKMYEYLAEAKRLKDLKQ